MSGFAILPQRGRGTMRSMVEGQVRVADGMSITGCPSTPRQGAGGPPPRAGEDLK